MVASCRSHESVVGTFPPETGSPTRSPTATPAPTLMAVSGTKAFQTPSRNIACVLASATASTPAYVRCDIAQRTWKVPKKPKDCPLDYGNGVILEDGKHGQLTCAGDTPEQALRARIAPTLRKMRVAGAPAADCLGSLPSFSPCGTRRPRLRIARSGHPAVFVTTLIQGVGLARTGEDSLHVIGLR